MERPYQRLLQAADADAAGVEWTACVLGLQNLDAYLESYGSKEGAYFLGKSSSLAEAATAPSLFRMVATLVRGTAAGHLTLKFARRGEMRGGSGAM